MRQECCGKPLRTPYCPHCGNKSDSEESLLLYLVCEKELAERRCARLRDGLDPEYKYYKPSRAEITRVQLQTWADKINRLTAWIAFVEAALADLAAKKTTK